MKSALLVTESSIYTDSSGKLIFRGGGEAYFHQLAKSLQEKKIKPTIFAIQEFKDQKSEEIIDGIEYIRYPVHSRTSLKLLKYLNAAIKRSEKYDYVYLNQFTPHLISPWIKKSQKIVVIHDVYQKSNFSWVKEYGIVVGPIGNLVEKSQLFFDKKHLDSIIVNSEATKRKLISKFGSQYSEKIEIRPYSINPDEYCSREKENFILFIGRFVEYKHPEHVLYALKEIKKEFPDFKAVFITPRIEKPTLKLFKTHQKKLGLSDKDIIIKENCDDNEKKELLAKAKLLIHPSYIEGQGIVILEALASHTPVVAYDLDVYKRQSFSKQNFQSVTKGDIEKMSEKAKNLIRITN